MALYTTTDMMASIICFGAAVRDAFRKDCGITVTEYRLISFLSDRGKPAQPADATKALGLSPAMTTLTVNSLVKKGFVARDCKNGGGGIQITKQGVSLSEEADSVLEDVHDSLFSSLAPNQKDTIVVGTQMTVMAVTKTNRVRNGSFFGEYETFHAFLIIERLMTETAQSCGLSMNGFRILFHLDEKGGSATPGELADALIVEPSAITYAAKALERDGLIERQSHKLDKRKTHVRITDYGAEVFRRADRLIDELLSTGFRDAPASEKKAIQDAATLVASKLRKRARWS